MTTLEQAIQARDNAFNAGDMESAAKLHAFVQHERKVRSQDDRFKGGVSPQGVDPDVPGFVSDDLITLTTPEPNQSSLSKVADVAMAPLDVAATVATAPIGMATGLGSMLTEAAREYFRGAQEGRGTERLGEFLRSQGPEAAFAAGFESGTFHPRTETGQNILEAVSEPLESLPPVLAPGFSQLPVVSQAVRGAAPIARARVVDPAVQGAQKATQAVAEKGRAVVDRAGQLTDRSRPDVGDSSSGAAQLSQARLRQERAAELDIPIRLTTGQATQEYEQVQFERMMAKDAKLGEGLRRRAREHHAQVDQNFDAWMDSTGREIVDLGEKGVFIDQAFQGLLNKQKRKINNLYDAARRRGEMEDDVELSSLVEYLNDPLTRAATEDSRVLKTIRNSLLNTNSARPVQSIDSNGNPITLLEAQPVNLNVGEELRKAIGNNTSNDLSDIRIAKLLKRAYDNDTAGAGGELYQKARKARAELANDFEDNDLVRRLTSTKLDTGEKLIAIEEMAEKSVLSAVATVDRIQKMKRILFRSPEGRQAWAEIQDAALQNIRNQVFSNADFDAVTQTPIPSFSKFDKAINKLDKSGKLEVIFTKRGAEKLRTLRDVTKTIVTAPKGTINTSDTATILAAMFDAAGSAATGVPAPLATGTKIAIQNIKDRKTKAKIERALRGVE